MKLAALALPALFIAAPAAAQSGTYYGGGTEPFWSIEIGKGSIVFKDEGSGVRVVTRTPTPRASFNGRRYVTRRITVDITRKECNDGMSDRRYADTLTVSIGRRTYRGCGNVIVDVAALEGSWTILSIDGRPVRTARPTSVRFEGSRISGNAGCNSFNGTYRIDRGALSASRVISTRMACPGSGMQTERAFLKVIAGPARLSAEGDRVTLSAPGGTVVLNRGN